MVARPLAHHPARALVHDPAPDPPGVIVNTVRLIPREALGPLVLGYTFIVVALVDMTAMAGAVAAGGLGDVAIVYGFTQFTPWVTWSAVVVIVIIVQGVQFLGNALARRVLRR